MNVIDKRGQTDVIYLDFAKAFDSVSHSKLLYKLDHVGIRGDLISWIKSFLTDRKQRVKIEESCSSWKPVTSGVPQGSVLGPVLFLIFVNDIVDCVKTAKVKIYADDCKIYLKANDDDSVTSLNVDLGSICTWSSQWQLPLSIFKMYSFELGSGSCKS